MKTLFSSRPFKALAALAALAIVAGLAVWLVPRLTAGDTTDTAGAVQTAGVARGDLADLVSSTGTLVAVGTVDVGTQVSGTLSKLYVDFNSKVTKGQVLAELDTSTLQAEVDVQQANTAKAAAELAKADAELKRNRPLFEKGYLSAQEFLTIETTVAQARASRASSQAALVRAKTNLGYAVIRSPISGTVIARSVEEGQTVAASLSAPTLFIIAEDLSKMQIEAAVDESDIGRIEIGQPVRFTVQSYPDRKFSGTVSQRRLNPTTVSNVVTYTVIVDARNDEGLLLPGMTATADFVIDEAHDTLLVPNAAFQYKPAAQSAAVAGSSPGVLSGTAQARTGGDATAGARRVAGRRGGGAAKAGAATPGEDGERKRLYYLADGGDIRDAWVVTGMTDGMKTAVEPTAEIHEGVKVVTGAQTQKKEGSSGGGLSSLMRPPRGGGGPPR